MVFTDVFGKSSFNIADLILSDNPFIEEDIFSKIHSKCKASHEDILNAISGVDFTSVQNVCR